MSGAPISWENKRVSLGAPDLPAETSDDYIDYTYAKYMGGHPLYSKPRDTGVYIYIDRIHVVNPNLVIPYSSIARIENMDEKKIEIDRILLLGLVGALWKKKHTYTVIQYREEEEQKQPYHNLGATGIPDLLQYREGGDKITIVLDFNVHINRIQPLIFNKVIEYKRK